MAHLQDFPRVAGYIDGWLGRLPEPELPIQLYPIQLGPATLLASHPYVSSRGLRQLAEYLGLADNLPICSSSRRYLYQSGFTSQVNAADTFRMTGYQLEEPETPGTQPMSLRPFVDLSIPYQAEPAIGAMTPSGQTLDLFEFLLWLDSIGLLPSLVRAAQTKIGILGFGAGIDLLLLMHPALGLTHAVLSQSGAYHGMEISPQFIKLAEHNLARSHPGHDVGKTSPEYVLRQSDLFSAFRDQAGQYAMTTLNPPGVSIPIEAAEQDPSLFPYAGGTLADLQCRYIRELATMLGPQGVGFMVTSSRTSFRWLEVIAQEAGLKALILSERLFQYDEDKFERQWAKAKSALAKYNASQKFAPDILMSRTYREALNTNRTLDADGRVQDPAIHELEIKRANHQTNTVLFERFYNVAFIRTIHA